MPPYGSVQVTRATIWPLPRTRITRRRYWLLGAGADAISTRLGSVGWTRQTTPGSAPLTRPELAWPLSMAISSTPCTSPSQTMTPDDGP